jgi:hypothetical protein
LSVSRLHTAVDGIINEYGAGGGMKTGRGNRGNKAWSNNECGDEEAVK